MILYNEMVDRQTRGCKLGHFENIQEAKRRAIATWFGFASVSYAPQVVVILGERSVV